MAGLKSANQVVQLARPPFFPAFPPFYSVTVIFSKETLLSQPLQCPPPTLSAPGTGSMEDNFPRGWGGVGWVGETGGGARAVMQVVPAERREARAPALQRFCFASCDGCTLSPQHPCAAAAAPTAFGGGASEG